MPIQYYMRAYNTNLSTYVDWIVNDSPDTTGTYSGYTPGDLTNIIVNRIVSSKIGNKQNLFDPMNSKDGYFYHLNSYDWLHPANPSTSPVPTNLFGLSIIRGYTVGPVYRDFASMFWDETVGGWKFAYLPYDPLIGEGVSIGASIPVFTGTLSIDTDPAQSGVIRIPNTSPNDSVVRGRNASNTADVDIVQVDTSNRVKLGSLTDPVYATHELLVGDHITHGLSGAPTTGFIRLQNGDFIYGIDTLSADLRLIGNTGDEIHIGDSVNKGIVSNVASGYLHSFLVNGVTELEIGLEFIRFDKDVDNPRIYQTAQTVGNGQTFTIQAQDTIGTTGGNLILNSGSGASSDGYIQIKTGNDVQVQVITGETRLYTPLAIFDIDVNAPTIMHETQIVGNGKDLSLIAQSTTAVGGAGGSLLLKSGNGTTQGNVDIFTGVNLSTRVATTSIISYVSNLLFDSAVVSPTIKHNNTAAVIGQQLTISAQTTTDLSGTGGRLYMSSGDGYDSAHSGDILLSLGYNDTLLLTRKDADYNHAAIISLNNLLFSDSQVTPFIGQYHNAIVGITAQDLKVFAQYADDGYGGNLLLSSGYGGWSTGLVKIQFGGATISNFGIDGYGMYANIGSIPAQSGTIRIDNNKSIKARNNVNNADLYLIGTDTFDNLILGTTSNDTNIYGYNVRINTNLTGDILFDTNNQAKHIYFDGLQKLYVNLMGSEPYLKAENGAYIDLPGGSITNTNNFAINGYHVDEYVTADNLSDLCNGSNADSLHTHSGTSGGDGYHSIIVGSIGALSNNTDGYLLTSLVELDDESFPAYVINSDSSKIYRLVVTCSNKPGAGESVVITVRLNGADTLLTVTLDNSTPAGIIGFIVTDLINNISAVIGDHITIRFVSSVAANVQNLMATIKVL